MKMIVAICSCGCAVGAGKYDTTMTSCDVVREEAWRWLRDGLTLRMVSPEEWEKQYLPGFLTCTHELSEPGMG